MQRPSQSSHGECNPVLDALKTAHGSDASLSLETFVEAALYAPGVGYYRRPAARVGHRADRDFYTASSLGTVFARLVIEGVCQLLPDAPHAYTWVEIGAEPDHHLLADMKHPFAAQRVLRRGEPLELEGPCVVFSNELFDAQPFRRFSRVEGAWRELGLRLSDSSLGLVPLPSVADLPADLPAIAPNGYQIDYPSGANRLVDAIAAQSWHGLFLAFDYGLPWAVLAHERPHGTARTYRAHRQGADLLAEPGEYDITHHICWDHLSQSLQTYGFEGDELLAQETFFMRHAASVIAQLIESEPGQLSPARQTLKTLLHPENMGRKFQVLHAFRSPS